MRIKPFRHEGVKEDGSFDDPEKGAVHVERLFRLPDTVRGESIVPLSKRQIKEEGHFICIGCPRTKDGVVEGVTIYFDSREELLGYLELIGEETYKFSEAFRIIDKGW